MSLCIASAGGVLALAVSQFTLSWTHSVERIRWAERWEVSAAGLRPVEVRLVGSGAGMEIPADAVFRDGAWYFTPDLPPQPEVFLAASGLTGGGWRLCAAKTCYDLGETQEAPIRLWAAASCD